MQYTFRGQEQKRAKVRHILSWLQHFFTMFTSHFDIVRERAKYIVLVFEIYYATILITSHTRNERYLFLRNYISFDTLWDIS